MGSPVKGVIMKICQVTCVHKRYDTRIFYKIAVSTANNGFDSYLLCMDDKGNETKNGVHFVSVNYKPKNRIQRISKAWRHMKKPCLEIDADIYQLHDPELLRLGAFLKKHQKKVIFDSHEDYQNISEKKWIPKLFRKPIKRLYLAYEKRVL